MTKAGRTALLLTLIGFVPVLMFPAFMVGLGTGHLVLIVPLFAAIVIALRPRRDG